MVIDTSAIVAVLLGEPEAEALVRAIASEPSRLVSAFSLLEASAVLLARKGPAALRELDLFVHAAGVTVVAFDEQQSTAAREAYERFGRGRHPAGLNLGDCCAYALARVSGQPLLFKGDDFRRTDLAQVGPHK